MSSNNLREILLLWSRVFPDPFFLWICSLKFSKWFSPSILVKIFAFFDWFEEEDSRGDSLLWQKKNADGIRKTSIVGFLM